jgi:hypothetical protein
MWSDPEPMLLVVWGFIAKNRRGVPSVYTTAFLGSSPPTAARGVQKSCRHLSGEQVFRSATGTCVPVLRGVREPNAFETRLKGRWRVTWIAVFHCTVSVTVPEFCSEPAVPAMVMVWVPVGVPGFVGPPPPPPPPPHAASNARKRPNTPAETYRAQARVLANRRIPAKPIRERAIRPIHSPWRGGGPKGFWNDADGAVVEMVSVEVEPPAPGVTEVGEKEQAERAGRLEQARDTALLYAAYCGFMLNEYVAD